MPTNELKPYKKIPEDREKHLVLTQFVIERTERFAVMIQNCFSYLKFDMLQSLPTDV